MNGGDLACRMKVVGLTGGIATGKSAVSAIIESERIPLVDCDKIAHAVVKKGRWGHRRVVDAFGTEILLENGELDRGALGSIVFSDPIARKKLNKATHNPVFVELLRQLLVHWLHFKALVIVDMPLLFETGSHKLASATILVACDEEVQMERLMRRDSCSESQAQAKVSSQMPLEKKRSLSDFVIDNNGSLEDTKRQTLRILATLRRRKLLQQLLFGPAAVVSCFAIVFGLVFRRAA